MIHQRPQIYKKCKAFVVKIMLHKLLISILATTFIFIGQADLATLQITILFILPDQTQAYKHDIEISLLLAFLTESKASNKKNDLDRNQMSNQ